MKVTKNSKTSKEIDEIEQASIIHIRSISEDLFSIMHQIQNSELSMASPSGSPINYRPDHKISKTESEQQDLIAFSFLKHKLHQPYSKKSPPAKTNTKSSVPAIHFASYMKPTRHLKQKIRQILISEREQQELQEERQRRRCEELKRMSNKNYSMIQSRYHKYDEKKSDKTQAVAQRNMEKELLEMSEVTFKPKINSNVAINQSFQERLQNSKQKKNQKEGQIIKDMIKGHTYQPKINSHKNSESKIKKIWDSPSQNKQKLYKTQQYSKGSLQFSPENEQKESQFRASAADLQFVINESLFRK